jgi:hypothetical protein
VAGTWVDPKSIEVRSAVNSLPEGNSVQLKAIVRCDDDSYLANGYAVHWLAASGPIVGSGGGWFTAQPVYRDTQAIAQATVFSLSGQRTLTILNSDPDNFGIYAGDDIDDAWQVAHFGLSNSWGLAGADFDGDGGDNYYEFTAGTDPLSASDFFSLKTIKRSAGVDVGIGPLSTNRTYTVERAHQLTAGSWAGFTNIALAAPTSLVVIANADSGTNTAFYRVAIYYPWRDAP